MNQPLLIPCLSPDEYQHCAAPPVDPDTVAAAARIIAEVRTGGAEALRRCIVRYESRAADQLFIEPAALQRAYERLSPEAQGTLDRTADRIRRFAEAQRACLHELDMALPGGRAGHQLVPIERVGCYAPGGAFPLPSSVLMTAIPARVAGVQTVYCASPSCDDMILAAAHVAGVDRFLWAGGAHAVATLAYGVEGLDSVDFISGPGNRWVTAAKSLVVGQVGIDMLAGPSELLVIADETAKPDYVAADLLAQAEHDADARVVVVTTEPSIADAIREACLRQLEGLPTAEIARVSLMRGAIVICRDREQAVAFTNTFAPEHLEVQCRDPRSWLQSLRHLGAAFLGSQSAEVFGDYGAGPNHVLPTGRTARFSGGLSVLSYIRVRTWLDLDGQDGALLQDAEALALHEGLHGHARSAALRITRDEP